ncbi:MULTISPECIES: DUF2019 domain-containing protein [unclassified Mesorhizobium]|uniref:DUF2019 domain-containing protein n=1 Tax=unclassified Mesorhizobium TaxID=325217 RepID=UPI0030153A42
MKATISKITDDELVARFIEISIAQGEASETFETTKFNRLFDRKQKLLGELRARQGDQRRLLFALYDHPNMQVRLNAAYATYALDPAGATAVFEAIVASKHFPWAGSAGMTLAMLEMGISQLPNDP